MFCGLMTELPRTLSRLPTPEAQWVGIRDAEPMQLVAHFVAQPLQGLALLTTRTLAGFKGWHQPHVLLEPRHHRDVSAFTELLLGARINVAHVGHNDVRMPLPPSLAVSHAGLKKSSFAVVGRRGPTHQRDQQYAPCI